MSETDAEFVERMDDRKPLTGIDPLFYNFDYFLSRSNPEPNSGCWIWDGPFHSSGYGVLYAGRRYWRSHRLIYCLHKSNLPAHIEVCHKCDVRPCVNPDHLFAGTRSDNMRDMIAKGRGIQPSMVGEKNTNARLTREIAEVIRQSPLSQYAAAKAFGVSRSCVQFIRNRRTWA